MNRRKWDPQTKSSIIIEGLKGRAVADLCTVHQISQAQYYQWREQFLKNLPRVFGNNGRHGKALIRGNTRLKKNESEISHI